MTVSRARSLRSQATSSERALWETLRRRQQWGLRFRRQYPIGPFVVDFICLERRLIVEIDGEVHDGARRIEADIARDRLASQRFKIVRIPNGLAEEDPDQACAMIAEALGPETVAGVHTPHPRPFPRVDAKHRAAMKGGREKWKVATEAFSNPSVSVPAKTLVSNTREFKDIKQ